MGTVSRKEGNTAIVSVEGKLSLGPAVDEFRAKWTEALSGSKDIVINLSGVPMVDSSGIGSLIRCHSAVSSAGGRVKVVVDTETVKSALKVTRLDRVIELHETEASALASFAAAAKA